MEFGSGSVKPRLFDRFPGCKSVSGRHMQNLSRETVNRTGREPSYVSRDVYIDTLADPGRTAESFGEASGFSYQHAALEFQDNFGPDLKANHSRTWAQPVCGRA
eukprot:14076271-Alexandrium_andersonii.AAC.1